MFAACSQPSMTTLLCKTLLDESNIRNLDTNSNATTFSNGTSLYCLDKNYIFQTTRFNHAMIFFKFID